jgi:hypothetical protein
MESIESKEKVKCAICSEMFPIITPSHLKKHHMSLSDYKEKFPDAPITSAQYKAKQKFLKGNLFAKEKDNPVINEIDLGDLTLKTEPKVDVEIEGINKVSLPFKEVTGKGREVVVSQLQIKKSDKVQLRPQLQIMPEKRKIIEFLQNIFPATSVINNFMIEKFYRDGSLEYQFATDIAIPSRNIDMEFTKSFWHNSQISDPSRNHKLERDGWTIVEIREASPSIDMIKSYLKHRKLI